MEAESIPNMTPSKLAEELADTEYQIVFWRICVLLGVRALKNHDGEWHVRTFRIYNIDGRDVALTPHQNQDGEATDQSCPWCDLLMEPEAPRH